MSQFQSNPNNASAVFPESSSPDDSDFGLEDTASKVRAAAAAQLDSLTAAQTDVMQRVVQHMTSKEIARDLQISPNTVDQRVKAALPKLGASDRADAARRFLELNSMCGRTIYGSSVIDVLPVTIDDDLRELPQEPHFVLEDSLSGSLGEFGPRGYRLLEVFDYHFGRFGRVALIILFAVLIAVLALTVISMGTTLSEFV